MRILFVLIALSMAAVVRADQTSTLLTPSENANGQTHDLTIPLPESNASVLANSPAVPPTTPGKLALAASSWVPADFEIQSRTTQTTAFRTVGLPEVSVAYLSSPLGLGGLEVRWTVGGSFLNLERDGVANLLGSTQLLHENMVLLPFKAGLEFGPSFVSWKAASIHLGAALLPTFGLTTGSVFDDGMTAFGVPMELSAGIETYGFYLPLVFGRSRVSFSLDGMVVTGSLQAGNMNGSGIEGGMRITL